MVEDWLSKAHENLEIVFNILWELRSLANCFEIVGNIKMFEQLNKMANNLERAHKNIRDSLGESLSESLQRSEEMTKAIVEATLAGCILGKSEK